MIDPILITGCARSGTSLTAGIINICGGFGGQMTGPTRHNRKGQFENTVIRDGITKGYFRMLGVDPLGQKPLPDVNKLTPYPTLGDEVRAIFQRQGYDGGPWFYKGAKMCLFWPVWHRAFPEARWIITQRPTEQIVDSCLRTPFMRAYKDRAGWEKWVKTHEARFSEMVTANLDITPVFVEDLIRGDFDDIRDFVENTEGLEWNEDAVMGFVEPALWRNGKGPQEGTEGEVEESSVSEVTGPEED